MGGVMKLVTVLRILAGLFLVIALILFLLHFICQYSIFWFSVAIAFASVLNLIASIKFLKIKKREEQRTAYKDNQNK